MTQTNIDMFTIQHEVNNPSYLDIEIRNIAKKHNVIIVVSKHIDNQNGMFHSEFAYVGTRRSKHNFEIAIKTYLMSKNADVEDNRDTKH